MPKEKTDDMSSLVVPPRIAQAIRDIVVEHSGMSMTDDDVFEAWEKLRSALPRKLADQLADEEIKE